MASWETNDTLIASSCTKLNRELLDITFCYHLEDRVFNYNPSRQTSAMGDAASQGGIMLYRSAVRIYCTRGILN